MTAVESLTTDGTHVITLRGLITEAESADLRTLLVRTIWHERPDHVRIDLAPDVAMDATAVGALVAAGEIAEQRRVAFDIHCPDPELLAHLRANGARTVHPS
jgi:anti-anti-sigma regulatory factor